MYITNCTTAFLVGKPEIISYPVYIDSFVLPMTVLDVLCLHTTFTFSSGPFIEVRLKFILVAGNTMLYCVQSCSSAERSILPKPLTMPS